MPNELKVGREPTLVSIRSTHCACQLDAAFTDALKTRLESGTPMEWPELEEIKRSKVRTILAGTIPDGKGGSLAIHVKLFRAVRLSDRARDLLQGSRATKELDNLSEARRRGLPAVRPIAAGRWTGSFGSRSFLITESVADAHPLPRGPMSEGEAKAAGSLLRAAHDAGLHARDLHPGNLVASPSGKLHLLDLTSATLANALEGEERAWALAFFCQDLDGHASDPRAAPLLTAYGASQSLVEAAVREGRRLRNRSLSAFGRRATRACKHTEVTRPAKQDWFLHRPAADLHAAALAWDETQSPPIKSGRRGAVYLSETLAIKKRDQGAAQKLFRAQYWLLFAGVPAPQPVALVPKRGLVFTQRIDAPNLQQEFASLTAETLAELAESFGESVGRLHAFGLRNRDMKFENLMRDPKSGDLLMVDLDGVGRHQTNDSRKQGADLGRLLAAYENCGPSEPAVIRRFWRGYARMRIRLRARVPLVVRHTAAERARAWHAQH